MANLRKIHSETLGNRSAKVYRDAEYQEFRARLYLDGVLYEPADYFTDSKSDAIETALAMVAKPNHCTT